MNKLTQYRRNSAAVLATTLTALVAGSGNLMAQAASGNVGADAILDELSTFGTVAAAVVAAAVLVKIVPWGAKIAIKVFQSIFG